MQKTAYEMRISDWSSDVCSSDREQRRSAAVDVRASRRLSVDAASPDQTVQTFRRRKRMHNSTRLMLIAAPLALAACDAGDQSSNSSAAPTATQDMPMNENMPMMRSGDGQTANGKGTVTAVDAAAGTVTIDHGTIPAVGLTVRAMTIKAEKAARQNVTKGDKVTFAFRKTEGGGEIRSEEHTSELQTLRRH